MGEENVQDFCRHLSIADESQSPMERICLHVCLRSRVMAYFLVTIVDARANWLVCDLQDHG